MSDTLDELLEFESVDDYYERDWLDRNYGGAPDECSDCYREGKLVKIQDCTNPDH